MLTRTLQWRAKLSELNTEKRGKTYPTNVENSAIKTLHDVLNCYFLEKGILDRAVKQIKSSDAY